MTSALHSVSSSEWYTPPEIIEAGRSALGGIDLDPATSATANGAVQATSFFTVADNGLAQQWHGRVFLNPPSPPRPWWERAIDEWTAGRVSALFYVAYSIETLSQSQLWTPRSPMLAFSVCIPMRRVAYYCTAADAAAKLREKLEKRLAKVGEGATPAELRRLQALQSTDPTTLVKGDQPTHASALVGVGIEHDLFRSACWPLGEVMRGRRAAA